MKRNKYEIFNPSLGIKIAFDNNDYSLQSVDFGSIENVLSTYQGSGQWGNTITARALGTREILIAGHVLADDAASMNILRNRLQLATSPIGEFQILVNNESKITCTALYSILFGVEFYQNNEQLCYFELTAVANKPFFETIEPIDAAITQWSADFYFPRSFLQGEFFTFGHREESQVREVNNIGNVSTGLQITFTAFNGSVKNPYIENVGTGEKLQINREILNGESVEINTTYGEKSIVNTTSGENWIQWLDFNSEFLQLPAGITQFIFGNTESEGTLNCNLKYSPKFMGAQYGD